MQIFLYLLLLRNLAVMPVPAPAQKLTPSSSSTAGPEPGEGDFLFLEKMGTSKLSKPLHPSLANAAAENPALRTWCVCTDAGGDISAAREVWKSGLATRDPRGRRWFLPGLENVLLLDIDYLMHQHHIICAESLWNADHVYNALGCGARAKARKAEREKALRGRRSANNHWKSQRSRPGRGQKERGAVVTRTMETVG